MKVVQTFVYNVYIASNVYKKFESFFGKMGMTIAAVSIAFAI